MSLILSLFISGLVFFVFYVALPLSPFVPAFGADIEGTWIETFRKPNSVQIRQLSYGSINYDRQSQKLIFSGSAFNESNVEVGTWKSEETILYPIDKDILYVFSGRILTNVPVQGVFGLGSIHFDSLTKDGKYITGNGYFADDSGIKYPFEINRIQSSKINQMIGKSAPENSDEKRKLIMKVREELDKNLEGIIPNASNSNKSSPNPKNKKKVN